MKQLHLWQEMKCCIDPTHKSYRSYRLGKMAKQMKGEIKTIKQLHRHNYYLAETGQVEALCASHDPTFSSHDPTFSSHDQDVMYKCRRCR